MHAANRDGAREAGARHDGETIDRMQQEIARLRKLNDDYLSEIKARGSILDAIQAEAGKGWWYGAFYELKRLRAGLPATADGVLVVPGMELFHPDGHSLVAHKVGPTAEVFQYQTQFFKARDFYSTREAARPVAPKVEA